MANINFKNSEIGPIPNEWEVKALGEICEIITKGTTPPYFTSNGVRFIKIENFINGKINLSSCSFVDAQTHNVFLKRSILQENDILFAIAGATVGKNAIICKKLLPANTNQALAIVRLKDKDNVPYVQCVFNSKFKDDFIRDSVKTGAQPNLTLEQMYNFLLPLPPLPEQRRIAAALSDIDALIDNLDALIDKKRLIKQATMQQLLSGKKRINGFCDKWVMKKFEDIFETISSSGKHIETTEYLDNGKYPIVDQGQKQIIGFTNLNNPIKCPKNGSIVFGDHTRIFKFVDFDFYVGADGTQVLNVKDSYYCRFVYYVCLMLDIPNTGYNRHFKFLKEAIFTLPPTIAEQSAISKILSDMDEEISLLEAKKEKYTHLKQGMMSELLSGRIRI